MIISNKMFKKKYYHQNWFLNYNLNLYIYRLNTFICSYIQKSISLIQTMIINKSLNFSTKMIFKGKCSKTTITFRIARSLFQLPSPIPVRQPRINKMVLDRKPWSKRVSNKLFDIIVQAQEGGKMSFKRFIFCYEL